MEMKMEAVNGGLLEVKAAPRKRPKLQIFKEIGPARFFGLAVGSFAFILIVWLLISQLELVNPVFLPKPQNVLAEMIHQLGTGEYWAHIGISVFRVTAGFLLACAVGIPLGIFAGAFRAGSAVIEPPMEFIRYMPAVAFIPLIMVWVGIGEAAKILLIFIGCFFQVVLMVADITRRVNPDLLHVSYTLGGNRRQVIKTVLLPAIMPELVSMMRLILGWAWTYLVVAELIAVNSGLGYAIMKAQRFLNTEQIFVGIIVIGLLGLISDRLFAFVHKRCFHWL